VIMKILYDGEIFAIQVTGGINRYFANIVRRFPQEVEPTFMTTYRRTKLHYPTHPNMRLREYRRFRPQRVCNWLQGPYFRAISGMAKYDILHPTYYTRLTKEPMVRGNRPLVVTVYDMIHEIFAEKIDPAGETTRAKKAAFLAADVILCISENTKVDLVRYFPQVEGKAVVTPLASEFCPDWAFGDEAVPEEPYFLYVGSRAKDYKNFDGLLLAMAKLAGRYRDLRLCVVGYPFSAEEERLIGDLGLGDRIRYYNHVTDAHLAKLYRCSVAFVYPSLYEGFGIPPLEAMTCGAAVIAADCSSIPEVVGDGGLLFDPRSVDELVDRMRYVLEEPGGRDRLIERGRLRQGLFSWDRTAEETLRVYRSLG
jgi:glycosyltransferase involved in cell wall biosynthesis